MRDWRTIVTEQYGPGWEHPMKRYEAFLGDRHHSLRRLRGWIFMVAAPAGQLA